MRLIAIAELSIAQNIVPVLQPDNEHQTVTPARFADETTQPENPLWPTETGTATYYAANMEGRLTASGEPYDPEQLTAAHRTLPIGSLVRVTHLKSNHQVVVRINDRWGGGGDRIINLSQQAAIELNFGSSGTAPVYLTVESLAAQRIVQPAPKHSSLPARIELTGTGKHAKMQACQNEADILGLIDNYYHNHITACLSRSSP
ncbi:MAG: septal ring lytic transglycosylase RlpA family protein [Nitrosomonas sp.]|nr:septal ring lytic transglycosylase RlpA family protein [Nitrosomonas sp.]MBP6077161.1 septal ring lytic transglycosylase RlpA family protein [Nitrosomonas sp.]